LIFFDTETCGFHGPTVLIQYAEDDGPIELHEVWTTKIKDTLELIEHLAANVVCGFNLAFDWFHLCQTYTVLLLLDKEAYPEDIIKEYAKVEADGRFVPCLKPYGALDLMLHARKGPYQSMMNRKDIRVKKIPTALAARLSKELDARIPLKDAYFARKKDKKKRWSVMDRLDDEGDIIPEFKDVVLKFAPSSALKALAEDALGIKTASFVDIDLPKVFTPEELGYAPFGGTWPSVIERHISHWGYNRLAREYAVNDVVYTRDLYKYFGEPEPNDDDSVLACMVGAVRWRGFSVDIDAIKALREVALKAKAALGWSADNPRLVRKYLMPHLTETERLVMTENGKITTKAVVLEEIAKWKVSIVCDDCEGLGCDKCNEGLIEADEAHPAAKCAMAVLEARHAGKEVGLYDKLIHAGRLHADMIVIGAKSSRMSGAGGLNVQGIRRANETRSAFPLADDGLVLCGGDFVSFEVNIADAAYGDPVLHEELLSGKKIHGLFGTQLFVGKTYDEIIATKGLAAEKDLYTRSKNGVFAMLYGGEAFTLVNRVGISNEAAEEAYQRWIKKYKVWGVERKRIFDLFCSMRQPGGIGSRVEWAEPKDYVESLFGFRRYFTLENNICRELYNLASDTPKDWNNIRIKVIRRDRTQTASGAVRSALFAAAFALQAANMRAAGNHRIQSSGAQKTKELQREIWELQPSGVSKWRVQPLNIHDEIMVPALPEYVPKVRVVVEKFIKNNVKHIPLLAIDWCDKLESWAEK